MQLASALADLARDHGTALFADPVAFRAALDDYLDEGTASSGTINLLVDAVRLGALNGLLGMLDSGAGAQAAVEACGSRLARDRGSNDVRGCQWACALLGHALGRVPEPVVRSLDPAAPGTGSVPPAAPPPVTSPIMSPPPPMSPPISPPTYGYPAGPPAPPTSPPAFGSFGSQPPSPYGAWQPPAPQRRRTGLVVALVAVLVVLVLGGAAAAVVVVATRNSDSSPSTNASSSTSPSTTPTTTSTQSSADASGSTLRGTGYTVAMPSGWTDQTKAEGSSRLDRLAVNASSIGGSTANVAVATSPGFGVTDPSTVRGGWEHGLRNSDPTAHVQDIADRQIDGDRAIGAHVTRSTSGRTLQQTAYLVVHGGTGYTIVFTYADGASGQDSVFEQFLSGWKWD